MKRQKRHLELHLAAAHCDRLRSSGSVFKRGDLILRVHGDRVKARVAEGGRYNSPPHFRGRAALTADGGVQVAGAIHESRGEVLMPRIFGFVALWMVLLIVIGIAVGLGSGGLAPFAIGAVGLPIFATICWVLGSARKGSFQHSTDNLQAALQQQLTGDGPAR